MYWIYLFIAGIFEILWAVGLKLSNGFSNLYISILTVFGMILSFYFLSLALKNIPLALAYAIWTGIGTIGTFLFGVLMFQEPISPLKAACVFLILLGVMGLKF